MLSLTQLATAKDICQSQSLKQEMIDGDMEIEQVVGDKSSGKEERIGGEKGARRREGDFW
jgi:hypothetical protein